MKLPKFFGLLLAAALFTGCSYDQEPAPNTNTGDASSVEAAALPVIDMHFHTDWPDADDAEYRASHLAAMDDAGIALSVLFVAADTVACFAVELRSASAKRPPRSGARQRARSRAPGNVNALGQVRSGAFSVGVYARQVLRRRIRRSFNR
jgi:hypothetical protein